MVEGGARAVLGEGPLHPALGLVGEQPGDQEDLQGHPFVGPAGQLLDRGAGPGGDCARRGLHHQCGQAFLLEQRGEKRLHAGAQCRRSEEISRLAGAGTGAGAAQLVVALGATAVLALVARLPVSGTVGRMNGRPSLATSPCIRLLLRQQDEARHAGFAAFVADLKVA